MKEEFLHFLWNKKKIPFNNLTLTNNKRLSIIQFGEYNQFESGPDFFNAEIEIDNIRWFGNIELHVNSSDWYNHRHNQDPSFENVILHVVYKHDKEVQINGINIPTLSLSDLIDDNMMKDYLNYQNFNQSFTCYKFISDIDSIYLESMKTSSIISRLNRKISVLKGNSDPQQNLFILLARSFGSTINADIFEEIANRLPIRIVKKEASIINSKNLFQGISGFSTNTDWKFIQSKYQIDHIPKHFWRFKGLRPHSFPQKRLEQLAEIVSNFDFETSFIYLDEDKLINYLYMVLEIDIRTLKLSTSMKDLILINCFVPFIWWYGNFSEKAEIVEKAFGVLNKLKSENNRIIKKWKTIGVRPYNSYDSQALLEIYNQFCTFRKCLQCDVGIKILNK
jgi:hypothetical protein